MFQTTNQKRINLASLVVCFLVNPHCHKIRVTLGSTSKEDGNWQKINNPHWFYIWGENAMILGNMMETWCYASRVIYGKHDGEWSDRKSNSIVYVITNWWFQPPEKYESQIGSSSQLLEKIKTCSKPPTRSCCPSNGGPQAKFHGGSRSLCTG